MKKRLVIVMICLALASSLMLGGCSNKEEDDKLNEDENTVIEKNEEEEGEEGEESTQGPIVENSYSIEVGKLAPNFTLENLDGEEVSLEEYRGKIVMLNFWATTCKFCIKEMPDMNKLQEENEDLVILAVNVRERKDKVKNYIENGGYDFEVLLDTKGDIAMDYLVSAFPTSYFIDKEGILLGGVPGMLQYPQMNQLIEGIRENQ